MPRYDLRPGCLTWRRSRAGPGWRRPAPRSTPPPTTSWATRTRAACRRCGRRWRRTWPGRAASASPPTAIVVCSGFAHGLALICQVLRARGGTAVALEQYGPQAHRAIARAHGLRCLALPVDGDGAVPHALGRAAAAVLTPAHQFPLGVTLAPRRRRDFIEWATASGGLVIEDDYDGEFRYDRQPVGAMQALAPDHVVYAGTASKSLAPGLRLGWLAVPAPLLDEVVAAKEAAGAHASGLDQLTLAAPARLGRLRPPDPARQAGLPQAPRPARRDRAPSRAGRGGHRDRGRPARGPPAARRPERGRPRRPARQRTGSPSRGWRATTRAAPATARRSSSATGGRPSTPSRPRWPGLAPCWPRRQQRRHRGCRDERERRLIIDI